MPKNKYFWLAIIWTLVITFLCLEPSRDLPKIEIDNIDKLVHGSVYILFTGLWFLYFKSRNPIKTAIIKAFFLAVGFGIWIEIAQYLFTTTRRADVLDALANTFGASIAVILILIVNKSIKPKNL